MKMFDKLKKKMQGDVEQLEAETTKVVGVDEPKMSKDDLEKQEVLRKELFGGVYDLNSFGANPLLIGIVQANLLFDLRNELRVLNKFLDELKKELQE